MRRAFAVGVALTAALATWLAAAAEERLQPANAIPYQPAGPDVQDVIFFGTHWPVLVRLRLRVGDQPFRIFWDDYFQSLFVYLDADGDGVLSPEEAKRVPQAQALLREMQGGYFNAIPGAVALFAELDTDPKDGTVSRHELAEYYRRFGLQALRLVVEDQGTRPEQLTEALFKYLDLDKDGRLSRDELARAPASLRKLDADDDELISTQELLSVAINPFVRVDLTVAGQSPATTRTFLLLDPEDLPARWTEPLLKQYDKDKNHKLSRAEVGLPRESFDRLDANQDGELDAVELARFLDRPAELELEVRFGKSVGQEATLTVRPLGSTARKITLDNAELEIGLREGASSDFEAVRRFYLGQFKAADADHDGTVDEQEVRPSRFQFLRGVFALADRDGDGKLTQQEMHDYLELQAKAAVASTALTITDFGRGLFELLDTNGDGRLGLRELRALATRLLPLARKSDGYLSADEIPHRFRLMLSRGLAEVQATTNPRPAVAPTRSASTRSAAAAKGPLWFRKMDRNGDGDVSPREFLGSLEDFRRIDRDGDGLIDAHEAEAADAWFRARWKADR